MPGTKEILKYFGEQEIAMTAASDSPRMAVEKNLRQSGIGDYFTSIVGGDIIFTANPRPIFF